MRVQRAEGSLARVWGEKPQRPLYSHACSPCPKGTRPIAGRVWALPTEKPQPFPYSSNTKLQSLSSSMGLVVSFALSSDSFTSPQSTPIVGSL